METAICAQCGAAVRRKPYLMRSMAHAFCNQTCYGLWQRTARIGIRYQNGKPVPRNLVNVPCHTCGKAMQRQPSAIKARAFCSRECLLTWRRSGAFAGHLNPAWMGGHSEYRGPNWSAQSAAARRRDSNTCQRCGTIGAGLPVHHKRPYRLFDNYRAANDLSNLVTLCHTCHGIEEIAFWRANPGLANASPFPASDFSTDCRTCGQPFIARSAAGRVCPACCTATCKHCGSTFFSRKAVIRTIAYCSRACRNAAIKRQPRPCEGCGTLYQPKKAESRFCGVKCRMIHKHPRRKSSPTT